MLTRYALGLAVLLAALAPAGAHAADSVAWMTADSTSRTVHFDIAMGATGEGSGLNFNGYAHGHMTITVPLGWTVSMKAVNEDSLPHSLEVVDAQQAPPMDSLPTAFPRAETIDLTTGMPPNQNDSLSFTADKVGRYWIMCAVPGHAAGGMWDWLVVSKEAAAPSVTFDKGP